MSFPERYLKILERLPLESMEIYVYPWDRGGYKYYAQVISPSFNGMPIENRRRLVMQHLVDHMEEIPFDRVAYVYTHAPDELGANVDASIDPASIVSNQPI